ncbi:MAG: winged helix-turn-helix domain-containing protein [Vicinamibacterales bacterium]
MESGPVEAGRKVLRFGVFELDSHSGELRKRGVRLKLQGKPFQVLSALLERPGQIVTREELQRRLWSSDVFVDVDSGLNTAANRLRIALGDSADNPRYIETLPRVGYRFIAPLDAPDTSSLSITGSDGRTRRLKVLTSIAAAALLALVVTSSGVRLSSGRASAGLLQFRQITFGRGQISGARFSPDGETILYSANWDDGPRQLYVTHPSRPESRRIGFENLRLASVSRSGELALLSSDGTMPLTGGTLSRVPMNGGAPVPVERNVMSADWSADGGRLAIVRAINGTNQLEFPIGTLIHKTSGWISGVRVSPDGVRLAFIAHPVRHDNQGAVKVAERGSVRTLSGSWSNAGGVAWHPGSNEVWFTASHDGAQKSLWAVNLSGEIRPAAGMAGAISLRDIAPDGQVLASRETRRLEMAVMSSDEREPRDLSLHDWSRVADVSADGTMVLFDESGVAAGSQYQVYVRHLKDDSAMRLGEGRAMAFSPNGRFVLTLGTQERTRVRVVPLGEGNTQEFPPNGLEYQWVRYFPDGKRLLALANTPGQPLRLFVVPLAGRPFPVTPPVVVRNVAIAPDGARIALLPADGKLVIYPVQEHGRAHIVPASEALAPLLWSGEDILYVQHLGAYTQIPTQISRLHLRTGRLEPWREIRPLDALGVNAITKVMLSQDTRTLVFNYRRVLSELFLANISVR